MKKDLDRSKASFKLDLIETANADPVVSPADFKLLSAYVAVMAWPSCKAWLVEPLGRAKTGLSHGQFWKSRNRLLGDNEEKRAYLIAVRHGGKVSTYKLINPWRDEARTLIDAMIDHHREVARQRKESKSATLSLQNLEGQEAGLSVQKMEGQNNAVPPKKWSHVPPKNGAYYPSVITPRKKGSRSRYRAGFERCASQPEEGVMMSVPMQSIRHEDARFFGRVGEGLSSLFDEYRVPGRAHRDHNRSPRGVDLRAALYRPLQQEQIGGLPRVGDDVGHVPEDDLHRSIEVVTRHAAALQEPGPSATRFPNYLSATRFRT